MWSEYVTCPMYINIDIILSMWVRNGGSHRSSDEGFDAVYWNPTRSEQRRLKCNREIWEEERKEMNDIHRYNDTLYIQCRKKNNKYSINAVYIYSISLLSLSPVKIVWPALFSAFVYVRRGSAGACCCYSCALDSTHSIATILLNDDFRYTDLMLRSALKCSTFSWVIALSLTFTSATQLIFMIYSCIFDSMGSVIGQQCA